MKVAAAQLISQEPDTAANIERHITLIDRAAKDEVAVVVFPEMSLTGYQMEDAANMAFERNDERLLAFKEKAIAHKMTIVVGAPISVDKTMYIGSFIFLPNGSIEIYTKQFLHAGEEKYFNSSFLYNPMVQVGNKKISLAICADIANPLHAMAAGLRGTTIYAVGIFYSSTNGINEAYQQLGSYAKQYNMHVLMANYAGVSYQMPSKGKSACWNNKGELIAQLANDDEGLLIASIN